MNALNYIHGYLLIYPIILMFWFFLKNNRNQVEEFLSSVNLSVIILGLLRAVVLIIRIASITKFEYLNNGIAGSSNTITIFYYTIIGVEIIFFVFLFERNRRRNIWLSTVLLMILILEFIGPILIKLIFGPFPDFIPIIIPFDGAIILTIFGMIIFIINKLINNNKAPPTFKH